MADFVYTIDEACGVAKIGRTTLYAAIRDGQLRARKAQRRTIILHDDLILFLQALPTISTLGKVSSDLSRDFCSAGVIQPEPES